MKAIDVNKQYQPLRIFLVSSELIIMAVMQILKYLF